MTAQGWLQVAIFLAADCSDPAVRRVCGPRLHGIFMDPRRTSTGASRAQGDPLTMDLISIGIALVVFVALYFLIDGLDRI